MTAGVFACAYARVWTPFLFQPQPSPLRFLFVCVNPCVDRCVCLCVCVERLSLSPSLACVTNATLLLAPRRCCSCLARRFASFFFEVCLGVCRLIAGCIRPTDARTCRHRCECECECVCVWGGDAAIHMRLSSAVPKRACPCVCVGKRRTDCAKRAVGDVLRSMGTHRFHRGLVLSFHR